MNKLKNNLILKRIGAYLIDFVIISFISSILTYISFINPKYDEYIETSEKYTEILNDYYEDDIDINELNEKIQDLSYDLSRTGYVYVIGDIVIAFLYFGLFAYFKKGQTLGKKALKIKIVSNKEDKELKPYNYFIRVFILNNIILNIIILIGLCFSKSTYLKLYTIGANIDTILLIIIVLMIFFQKDGRGLHDVLAGTKVIDMKENTLEEEIPTTTEKEEKIEIIKPKKRKKKEDE